MQQLSGDKISRKGIGKQGGREGEEGVRLTVRVSVTIRAAVGEGCQGLTGSEPRRERARATEREREREIVNRFGPWTGPR